VRRPHGVSISSALDAPRRRHVATPCGWLISACRDEVAIHLAGWGHATGARKRRTRWLRTRTEARPYMGFFASLRFCPGVDRYRPPANAGTRVDRSSFCFASLRRKRSTAGRAAQPPAPPSSCWYGARRPARRPAWNQLHLTANHGQRAPCIMAQLHQPCFLQRGGGAAHRTPRPRPARRPAPAARVRRTVPRCRRFATARRPAAGRPPRRRFLPYPARRYAARVVCD